MTHDARFDRQVRFAPLGAEGQARLSRAQVTLVGCGALGGVLAEAMVRTGVGRLVLVDRDVVEPSNLARQVLFDEAHAAEGTPKVRAAVETLARIGGPTELVPHATHFDAGNVAELTRGSDLVLDGTDNLETRYLINDHCVASGLPWVYAGVVGGAGLVMGVRPGRGACLRCLFPEPPPPGSLPTCDSAGVVLPAVGAVASMAAGIALRWLATGGEERAGDDAGTLLELDAWNGEVRSIRAPRDPECPTCGRGEFPFLEHTSREPVLLCGRNAVQLPPSPRAPDLDTLAAHLPGGVRPLVHTAGMLRFAFDEVRFTIFKDGRALIEGTQDPDRARALYDRVLAG